VTLTIGDQRIDVGQNATIHASAVYSYDGTPYDGLLILNDTVYSQATVGRRWYTVSLAAGDSLGINSIETNDVKYVIWDQIRVLSYAVTDLHCDIDTVQSIYVTLLYEFDATFFTDTEGTAYLNGSQMVWDSIFSRWSRDRTYSSVGARRFQVSSIIDSLYGLTVISDSLTPPEIIWDKLEILIQPDALVVNWDTQVNFTVTGVRQYDGSRIQLLTVSIERNETSFAAGNFSDIWSGPVDTAWQYSISSARDDYDGLVRFDASPVSVKWTEAPVVVIDEVSMSDSDGRTNAGTVITVELHCAWSTNESNVDTGILYVNNTPYSINTTGWISFTWNSSVVARIEWHVTAVDVNGVTLFDQRVASSCIWDTLRVTIYAEDSRIAVGESANVSQYAVYEYDGTPFDGLLTLNSTDFQYFEVGAHGYTIVAATNDSYGITVIGVNDEITVVWDRLLVVDYSVTDSRCDVGTSQQIRVQVVYEYDNAILTAVHGLVYLNGSAMNWNPAMQHWFQDHSSSVEDQQFFIVTDINDFNENITVFDPSSPISIIWDSIEVQIDLEDARINVGENASIHVTAFYTFDGAVYDGILVLNDTSYSSGQVGRKGYTVVMAFGDSLGITVININDEISVIWDALRVDIIVGDHRINVGENASIVASAVYEYDDTPYDGVLVLNVTRYQYTRVIRMGYTALSGTDDSHGITVIGTNDAEYIIWDNLKIILESTDSRVNIGTNISVIPLAYYYYDGAVYDGILVLNDTVFQQDSVGSRAYTVAAVMGDSHGISAIGDNDELIIIWDSLTITLTIGDHHINVGDIASILVSAVYDYDGTPYDGGFTLNDTTFQYSTVGRRGYTVISASGDAYQIDAIGTNDAEGIIWDQLEVYWSQIEKERAEIDSEVDVRFRVQYVYDGSSFSGMRGDLRINDTEASYDTSLEFWYLSVTHDEVARLRFSVSSCNDMIEGIRSLVGADVFVCEVAWDQVFVSGAGLWGRLPAFNPEVELPAPATLRSELDAVVTVYFYLRYQSDGSLVTNPSTIVVINGNNAEYVEERERWELDVTSSVIGDILYEIEVFGDEFGITRVDHKGLYLRISWFPNLLLVSLGGISTIGLIGSGAAVFIRRRRRHVTSVEEAPEAILSVGDVTLRPDVRKDIVAASEWLRQMSDRIPELDDGLLSSFRSELNYAHSKYSLSFQIDSVDSDAKDMAYFLKKSFLDRLLSVITLIDDEIASRSG
jgi:hypothetical protein